MIEIMSSYAILQKGEMYDKQRKGRNIMQDILNKIIDFNNALNEFVWVKVGLVILIGTGILMTCLNGVFQIRYLKDWWKHTIGSVFKRGSRTRKNSEEGSVSQFQALCTALAATIGTGNIAGVASAIVIGGPGAVFWMWVAAFFGMMTSYSENVLGIYFRRKNAEGEWSGGAMYYLKEGLGRITGYERAGKILAVLFASFAILASFGIGNMGQINKIVINMESAFFKDTSLGNAFGSTSWISVIIGLVLMVIGAVIIIGGLQRIAVVSERVVPFMACAYILGALVIFCAHIDRVGAVFASIFRFAFGVKAVTGGVAGIAIKEVVTAGCKRGVFSNEAGLGSSVMVNSNSNVVEPARQGMWGIFEVFMDTFVVCTMTAVVVLSSGYIDLDTGMPLEGVNDATLVAQAFENVFGRAGEMFVAVAVLLFAFTTVLGWSHYGAKCVEYLFGLKATKVYRIIFVLMIMSGAIMTSTIAWDISDTFNGLMMIPNLIGVISLSPVVIAITRNYIARYKKNKKVEPMISAYPDIQEQQAAKLREGRQE